MTKLKPAASPILAVAAALAACGSTPAPVTVVTTASPATRTGGSLAPPQATQTAQTTRTTTAVPPPTRTAPAPAFTRTTGAATTGGDLQAAVAKLGGLGFTPVTTSTYDPNQTLRVLVGARTGRPGQRAFFFDGAKYLGTDAAAPSGMIGVLARGDTDVTLRYGIYRSGDPACCPAGSATVHFTLDGGHLVALDTIPSAAARR